MINEFPKMSTLIGNIMTGKIGEFSKIPPYFPVRKFLGQNKNQSSQLSGISDTFWSDTSSLITSR